MLPERQSDLVVTNLALVTSPVYKGQDFSVSVTVQNQGAMTITQVSALGIYVDHQPTGPGDAAWKNTTMVPTLGPGASHTATVVIPGAAVTSVGNHQVFAFADIGDTVVERNATLTGEDNNAFGPVPFTAEWPPLPDLYLVDVTMQGATEDLPAREAITYTVYVQNDGPVASSAASLALFADPDGPPMACNATGAFAWGTIPAILPGEAAAVVVRTAGFTTPGTYNVWAFADYTCNLDEYQDRESNNQYAFNMVVGPPRLADLRVRDLAPKDGVEVIAGKYFTLTVDIINEGDLESGATRLGVYTGTLPSDPDPVKAWQADVGALAPNESTLIDMPNRRIDIPGSQHVWAFADFFAWEEESDETDNVYTGTLTVLAPNLKVTALTLQPATDLHAQEYFTATVTVLSNGDVPSEATWLVISLDGEVRVAQQVPALAYGQTSVHVFPGLEFATGGAHTVSASVDPDNDFIETDETDNKSEVVLDVLPARLPDLKIASFTADNADAGRRGQRQLHAGHEKRRDRENQLDHLRGPLLRLCSRAHVRAVRHPLGVRPRAGGRPDLHRHLGGALQRCGRTHRPRLRGLRMHRDRSDRDGQPRGPARLHGGGRSQAGSAASPASPRTRPARPPTSISTTPCTWSMRATPGTI